MVTINTADKRDKKCEWCGEGFRDNTKPNNKLTCSRKCGDERRKKLKRDKYREDNPRKLTVFEQEYHAGLEYPHWRAGNSGQSINHYYRVHAGYDPQDLEIIEGIQQVNVLRGGKRKGTPTNLYNGDKDGETHKVTVIIPRHKREAGEVVVTKRSAAEIEADLTRRYGDKRK